jgi:hypothetical protein
MARMRRLETGNMLAEFALVEPLGRVAAQAALPFGRMIVIRAM